MIGFFCRTATTWASGAIDLTVLDATGPVSVPQATPTPAPPPVVRPARVRAAWFVLWLCGCSETSDSRHALPDVCPCHGARRLIDPEPRDLPAAEVGHACDQPNTGGHQ